MDTIFGIETSRAMVAAVRGAYATLFESRSNPLSRALHDAAEYARELTGADESASILVNNVRNLVTHNLWDTDDGAADCRHAFKKYYRFLLPVVKEMFHGDSASGYDLVGATRFAERLRAIGNGLSVADDGSLLNRDGTRLTPDAVNELLYRSPNRVMPGDSFLPATKGHYIITRIDSHADLMSHDLYQYTGWCICDPNRGEYQFDNYNGANHSNTCYLVEREGFESLDRDDPDYPSSLICLFVDPNGELMYAFDRDNDRVSARFIEEVVDDEMQEAFPPVFIITPQNMCDKLQAICYVASDNVDIERAIDSVPRFSCTEIYSSRDDEYGVRYYEVGDRETGNRNILFEFNTGYGNVPNFMLLYPKWNYSDRFEYMEKFGHIIGDDGNIFDCRGHRIFSTRNYESIGPGVDTEHTGLYEIKSFEDGRTKVVNLLYVDDGAAHYVFSKNVDIGRVYPGTSECEAEILLRDGTTVDINGDTSLPVDPDAIGRFAVPEGYVLERNDVVSLKAPVAAVWRRVGRRQEYNVIDREGSILLPEGIDGFDRAEYDPAGHRFIVEAYREPEGSAEPEIMDFTIDTDTMSVEMVREDK